MEFKEYLKIIKKYKKVFFVVWGSVFLIPLVIIWLQPVVYEGRVTALIVRDKSVNDESRNSTREYDYFYKLESDKKIANMVISFLDDMAMIDRSFEGVVGGHKMAISKSEKEWMGKKIKGEVLSSGYLAIEINGHNKGLVEQLSGRIIQQLNGRLLKISDSGYETLRLEAESGVVSLKSKLYLPISVGGFFGGLLMAIFSVLLVHYWRGEE